MKHNQSFRTNAFELEQKKQNIISDSNDILMFIKKNIK